MQHRWLTLLFLLVVTLSVRAQGTAVSGRIIDKTGQTPLERATLQLLRTDSTFVGGTLTDERGRFSLEKVSAGTYLLKVTNLGYKTIFRNITVERRKPLVLGDIALEVNTIELDEAQVTANLPPMVIKDGTKRILM